MKYKKSDKDFFINPYNFVSVNIKETKHFNMEEMSQEEPVEKTPELQTGYLVCRMKCRTPLAIPDTANKKETDCEGHFKYHFMGMKEETLQGTGEGEVQTALTGTPMIPGSSIRGVIRNVYETITDSCFGTMRENTRITARSNQAFKPGLLIEKKEGWKLYSATKHKIVMDSEFYESHGMNEKGVTEFDLEQWRDRNGVEVWFNTITYKKVTSKDGKKEIEKRCVQEFLEEKQQNLKKKGYLCIGEESPERHFYGIFEQGKKIRDITEEDIKRLEYTLEIYRNEKINKLFSDKHSGYPDYERMKNRKVIPVYYQLHDNTDISNEKKHKGKKDKNKEMSHEILYLSLAAIGRKAYEKTLNEKAGQKSHQICNDRNNLCAACSLFGTIEGQGMGSKIRFTDAECRNFERDNLMENVIFEELSSPRISYAPFYLRSLQGNTDYSVGYDSEELEIRGRKFYWHHQPRLEKETEKTERNGTFDVLLSKSEFEFRVYFERITKKQLEILATAIHLNENDIEGNFCHKMGHGKPLGYGSVKIVVDNCMIRKYSLQDGWSEKKDDRLLEEISYSNLFDDNNWENPDINLNEEDTVQRCDKSTWVDLKKISNYHENEEDKKIKVEYPGIVFEGDKDKIKDKNALAGHQWYTRNYNLGASHPENCLPKIKDEQKLVKYILVEEEQAADKSKQKNEKNKKGIKGLPGKNSIWQYNSK